ncbi:MAG: CBS domain-containing protein [Rhodospirillales bacterium]
MLIEYILGVKGENVTTVMPDTSLRVAAAKMQAKAIGIVVVRSHDGDVVGVLSERDCVRGIALYPDKINEMMVKDLMTADPITCAPDSDPIDVMVTMKEGGFRHMPVVKDGRLTGLISITDLNRFLLAETDMSADWRQRLQRAGLFGAR